MPSYVEAFRALFPEGAGYEHDRLERRHDLDPDQRAVERHVERLLGRGVQHRIGRHAEDLVAQRRRHDDVGAAVLVPQAGREQIILGPAIAAEIAVGGRRRRDDARAEAPR